MPADFDSKPYVPLDRGSPAEGVFVRTTPRGFRVLEIDYWADPDKRDPAWIKQQEAGYQNKGEFRREFLRDWTTSSGLAVYPDYRALHDRGQVRHKAPGLIRDLDGVVTVYRGWDFGLGRPACVWAQIERRGTAARIWLLREIMPEGLNTYQFRDLVLALSGQRDPETLAQDVREGWWRQLVEASAFTKGRLPKPPWFGRTQGRPIRFVDYAGHEALQPARQVENTTAANTDAQILAEGGVQLTSWRSTRHAREELIRKQLMLQDDGAPGLLVDPQCDIIHLGFLGGISFPDPTKENPYPQESKKDGYFEHLHDAVGYIMVNEIAAAESYPAPPPGPTIYTPKRAPMELTATPKVNGMETLGFNECYDRDADGEGQPPWP